MIGVELWFSNGCMAGVIGNSGQPSQCCDLPLCFDSAGIELGATPPAIQLKGLAQSKADCILEELVWLVDEL
jgi:hypothetical protein